MEKYMIQAKNSRKVEFYGPYDSEAKAKEMAKVLGGLGRTSLQVKVIWTCSTVVELAREARETETPEEATA